MNSLLDEIRSKCSSGLLATHDTHAIAAKVSEGRVKSRKTAIGPGTVLDLLGIDTGNVFLDLIDTQPAYRWAKIVLMNGVLDLSAQTARNAVQQMIGAGVLSQEQGEALLSLATEANPIDEFSVRRAVWSDEGEWLP